MLTKKTHPFEVAQQASFYVAGTPVMGKLILAPMDGFSDMPFRSICRSMGSAMSYTEFINTFDVLHALHRVEKKLTFLEDERPMVFQVFDSDPSRLLEAALRLQEYKPDIIDINMGCSVRRVSGRGAGAGLLRTPVKTARILRTLSRSLDVPVSAKIRLGWDDASRNYLLMARIIEENGGALIAVHGRTREQRYEGRVDWDAIAEIKQAVSIPVIANGDVRTTADIEKIQAYTKCDGVMIGRAAIGNPWIFSHLDRERVSFEMVQEMIIQHLDLMLAFYGTERGLVLFRKHASQYISPYKISHEQRQRLLTAESVSEFLNTVHL